MTERNGGLMTNEEAIKLLSQIMDALLASNSWLPSTKNPIKESFGMAISALTAQDEKRTEERTETHGVCLDVIDRQATLDWLKNEWNGMITSLFDGIKALPSAQPELPEWAQKVEEYRKIAPKTFSSPIAWALYQTWREYAERRTDEGD